MVDCSQGRETLSAEQLGWTVHRRTWYKGNWEERGNAKNSIESADSSSLRSFAPAVPMMKAAEPSVRGVLIQGIVNPILVVVVHVIENEPPQMSFVQSDDMVEHLAAAASHPALCDPICQGA